VTTDVINVVASEGTKTEMVTCEGTKVVNAEGTIVVKTAGVGIRVLVAVDRRVSGGPVTEDREPWVRAMEITTPVKGLVEETKQSSKLTANTAKNENSNQEESKNGVDPEVSFDYAMWWAPPWLPILSADTLERRTLHRCGLTVCWSG
jgi:hypothetical protein